MKKILSKNIRQQANLYIGFPGELTLDMTSYTLSVHDGSTPGGLQLSSQSGIPAVTSVAGRTGAVVLTKSDVGLNNVDNISSVDLRSRSTHTGTQLVDTISDSGETGRAVVRSQIPLAARIAIGAAPQGVRLSFTSRALTDDDFNSVLLCASPQTATVNTGRVTGFGCCFKGPISFDGAATVTDVRTAGAANPWCALVQTGTDTYDVVGGKA